MPDPKSTLSHRLRLGAFGWSALDYFDAGWFPIPVVAARQRKAPLVKGYTGYHDEWPDRSTVEQWTREFPVASVGLRLSKNIIGIDFDMYGGKNGRRTLDMAEEEYGPLPPTWITTSRVDGSGIRLYRLPEGLESTELGNRLGPDTETIRWCHRYATAPPSTHHTGNKYEWWRQIRGKWSTSGDYIPTPNDLTELPANWAKWYPRAGIVTGQAIDVGNPDPVIVSFLGRFDPDKAPMSMLLKSTVEWWNSKLSDLSLGSAHDTMIAALYAIVNDVYKGESGARQAFWTIGETFKWVVRERRSQRVARNELRRAAATAILKLARNEVEGE